MQSCRGALPTSRTLSTSSVRHTRRQAYRERCERPSPTVLSTSTSPETPRTACSTTPAAPISPYGSSSHPARHGDPRSTTQDRQRDRRQVVEPPLPRQLRPHPWCQPLALRPHQPRPPPAHPSSLEAKERPLPRAAAAHPSPQEAKEPPSQAAQAHRSRRPQPPRLRAPTQVRLQPQRHLAQRPRASPAPRQSGVRPPRDRSRLQRHRQPSPHLPPASSDSVELSASRG